MEDIDVMNWCPSGTTEEELTEQQHKLVLAFCEKDNLLDKRVSKVFSMNKWLYNVCEKDDLKQEILLKLFNKSSTKFPYITGEDRLKYFNSVVSNAIFEILKYKLDRNPVLVLTQDMMVDTSLGQVDNEVQEIFDLFVNEELERQLVELYYQGYSERQIREIMSIGRKKFESIRDNVRKKIKENYL